MPDEKRSSLKGSKRVDRKSLPKDLEERLLVVWRRLGHLIDWCSSSEAWTKMFCSETRPYRQTFYWEAIADIVSDHMIDHPTDSPEDVLSDCLIATQQSPSSDDPSRLTTLREMWDEILCSSNEEIEAFTQSDLELAKQEGTCEVVTALYRADDGKWKKGDEPTE